MTLPLPPQPPIKEPITSKLGTMSMAWVTFFSNLTSYLKTNKDYVEAPLDGNDWLSGLSQAGSGGYDAVVSLVSAAVADGSIGVNANAVGITTTAQAFTYDTSGLNPAPTSATLTAIQTNSYGELYYEWLINDVSVQNSIDPTYTYSPQSDFALMPDKIEVQVHQDTDTGIIVARDMMTMFGLKAGSDALTVILTNEAHTLPVSVGGVVTYTGSGTSILCFQGTTQLVEDSAATPANSTFKVTSAVGTNITPGSVTGSGTAVLSYGDASAMTATAATIAFNLAIKTLDGIVLAVSKTQSFAQSVAGSSGSGARAPTHLYISGTSWSDVAADAAFVTFSVTKMNQDRVTISGTGFAMVKYWDTGTSAWIADGAVINGNLIVTNTITSSQINANGLTIRDPSGNVILDASGLGGNIDYGLVSGSKPGYGNLLKNAGFNGGNISGWTINNVTTTVVPAGYTDSNNILSSCSLSKQLAAGAGYSEFLSDKVPAIGGAYYEFSGYLYNYSAAGRIIEVYINFYNSSLSLISSSASYQLTTTTTGNIDLLSSYVKVGGFATAPAGTVSACFVARLTTVSPSSVFRITKAYLGIASAGQTQTSDWSNGYGSTIGGDLGGAFTSGNIGVYMPTAVIGTAQITDLSATKITAGSITVGVGLGTSGYINSGQTAFNTGTGFWLEGGTTPKFSFGNSTNNINWNGSALSVNGSVIGTTNIVPNALSLNKVSTSNFNSYLAIPSPVINESHSGGFITTGSEGALSVLSAIGTGTYDQTVTLTITCTCTVSSFETTPGYIKFKLYDNSALTTLAMRFFTPNDRTSAYDYDISATPRATSYTTFEMSYTGTFPASASHTLTFQASIVTGRTGYSWTYEPFISNPRISIVGTQR